MSSTTPRRGPSTRGVILTYPCGKHPYEFLNDMFLNAFSSVQFPHRPVEFPTPGVLRPLGRAYVWPHFHTVWGTPWGKPLGNLLDRLCPPFAPGPLPG